MYDEISRTEADALVKAINALAPRVAKLRYSPCLAVVATMTHPKTGTSASYDTYYSDERDPSTIVAKLRSQLGLAKRSASHAIASERKAT